MGNIDSLTRSSDTQKSTFDVLKTTLEYRDPFSGEKCSSIDNDNNILAYYGLQPQLLKDSPHLLRNQIGYPDCFCDASFGTLFNSLLYTIPLISPKSDVFQFIWATRCLPFDSTTAQRYSTLITFSPADKHNSMNTIIKGVETDKMSYFHSPMFSWVPNQKDMKGLEIKCESGLSLDMTFNPNPDNFPAFGPNKNLDQASIICSPAQASFLNFLPARGFFPATNPLILDNVEYEMNYHPFDFFVKETITQGYQFGVESMTRSFHTLWKLRCELGKSWAHEKDQFTIHASMPQFNVAQVNPSVLLSPQGKLHQVQIPMYIFAIDVTDLLQVGLLWKWLDCFRVLNMQNSAQYDPDVPLLFILLNSVTHMDKICASEIEILAECERLGLLNIHFFSPSSVNFFTLPTMPSNITITPSSDPAILRSIRDYIMWSQEIALLCGIIDRLLANHIYTKHIYEQTHAQQKKNQFFLQYYYRQTPQFEKTLMPTFNLVKFPQYMSPPIKDSRGRYVIPLQREYVPSNAVCGSCPLAPDGSIKPTSTKHTSLSTVISSPLGNIYSILIDHWAKNFIPTVSAWAMAGKGAPYKTARFFRGRLVYKHSVARLKSFSSGHTGVARLELFDSDTQDPIWNPGCALFRHYAPSEEINDRQQLQQRQFQRDILKLSPEEQKLQLASTNLHPITPSPSRIHANVSFIHLDSSHDLYPSMRPLFSQLWALASFIFIISLDKLSLISDPASMGQIASNISSQLAIFDFFGLQTCPVYFIFLDDVTKPTDSTPFSVHEADFRTVLKFFSRLHPSPWADHRIDDGKTHINIGFCKPLQLQETLIDVQRMALHEYSLHFHKHTLDELTAAKVDPQNVKFSIPIAGEFELSDHKETEDVIIMNISDGDE